MRFILYTYIWESLRKKTRIPTGKKEICGNILLGTHVRLFLGTHDFLFGTHDFFLRTHDFFLGTHDFLPTTHDFLPTTFYPRPTTFYPRLLASPVFTCLSRLRSHENYRLWIIHLSIFTAFLGKNERSYGHMTEYLMM